MSEALIALRDYQAVGEAVMLQTCGRLEIYAELADYETGVAQLKAFLANFRHGDSGYDLESYLYTHLGQRAVEHLFRVCTGLDSMLIGEAEILGQVKDAYVAASQAQSIGRTLHRLFRDAISAGKAARAQTGIGDRSISLATAAIEAARDALGTLEGKNVLVVGAGKMGAAAVKRLRLERPARVVVANRTLARSCDLVTAAGNGEAIELQDLDRALAASDAVIASTGAAQFVLDGKRVAAAMSLRGKRPLCIVDIAVPRDVDPEVAAINNVSLVDVDGLRSIVDERLNARREAIPAVERLIAEYAERFESWYRLRATLPVIARLTQKAEAMRQREVQRLFARCPELNQRQRTLIVGTSMTIVSKLLHSAILKIRDKAGVDRAAALSDARTLNELFDLDLSGDLADAITGVVPDAR